MVWGLIVADWRDRVTCASYLPAREAVLVDGGDIIENMFDELA